MYVCIPTPRGCNLARREMVRDITTTMAGEIVLNSKLKLTADLRTQPFISPAHLRVFLFCILSVALRLILLF